MYPNPHENLKSKLCETADGDDSHQGICPSAFAPADVRGAIADLERLAEMITEHPFYVTLNREREAVQVFDCKGAVTAQFVLEAAALSELEARLALAH